MRRLFLFALAVVTALCAEAASMSVDLVNASCRSSVTVPVRIDAAPGAIALEFRIAFDAARLSNPTVTSGSLTSSMKVTTQEGEGSLRVTLRSVPGDSIGSSSDGTIANVTFFISGATTGRATLALSNATVATQLTMNAAQTTDGGINVSCSGGCVPAPDVLCLLARFRVSLMARDFRTNNTGTGLALPQSEIFGYFSIPALTAKPENPEVFVKILDGRQSNGKYWVFYGGLTDLEYTLRVTDTSNNVTKDYNKAGGNNCGNFDVSAFSKSAAGNVTGPVASEGPTDLPIREARDVKSATAALNRGCIPAPDALCLGGRFGVKLQAVDHRTAASGPGLAIPENDLFGFFSIPQLTNDPSNPEVFVKVLDGTAVNQRFWVFYGSLTDFKYTVTVTDYLTGAAKEYVKEGGSACGAFDVSAFPPGGSPAGCATPTFTPASKPITVDDPINVAALDVDKDGKPDLAVTQFGIGVVSVFRGDGRGGFTLGTAKTVAAGPYGVALTDIDADGRPDLVTANASSNTVSVFYGDAPNSEVPISFSPRGARDRPTGASPLFAISPSRLTLWTADDEDFQGTITVITECDNRAEATPVINRRSPSACPTTTRRGVGFAAGHFATLDLGHDGVADDVAISQYHAQQLSVFDRNLKFAGGYDTAGQPTLSAPGDFNNDGIADLAIVNDVRQSVSTDRLVSVLVGRGDGTFDRAPDLTVADANAGNGIAVADFNRDGNQDIVVAEQRSAPNVGYFSFFWIFPGKGTARFGDAVPILNGTRFWGVATADFNLDGRPDLALADQNQDRVFVLLNACTQ